MSDSPSQPLVSVVMPAHRRPETLRKAIASVREQSYPHAQMELVVVATADDGSAAVVTEEAARSDIPMRCVTIPDDPFGGRNPSAKRNYGVHEARGEWIAFIDDDCVAHADWIAGAAPLFAAANVGGIEGRKEIPPVDPPTNTYLGLLNFTRPGGYQTCNMFYRRQTFLDVGGFDTAFPFYLEDTDLAWTVLDRGLLVPHASDAVVMHPVTPPQPWRMLDGAKRVILMPYLCSKHQSRYRSVRMRALRWAHWAYLVVYAAILLALSTRWWAVAGGFAAVVPMLMAVQLYKMFHGCRVERHEFWVTFLLLPILPVVMIVQLIRGNLRNGVWLWT